MKRTYLSWSMAALLLLQVGYAQAADVLVSAAASLAGVLNEIKTNYEHAHPEMHLIINLGGSNALLQQIQQGAPADVFLSADMDIVDRGIAAGVLQAETRHALASNAMVLVVPTDTKLAMPTSLSELKDARYRHIAIGVLATVPAGHYAHDALQTAGLWDALQPKLVYAESVRQVLVYVERGEADAGFVYSTDAATARDRVRVAFAVPTSPIHYGMARVSGSAHAAEADDFIAYVLSPAGQAVFAQYGFLKP